jgi:hypothetical protein
MHEKENMWTEKSVPYYFEPAPPVRYNEISSRILKQWGEGCQAGEEGGRSLGGVYTVQ